VSSMEVNTARPRLLLVEDDRATYTALKGILTLRGWDVVVATTVAEGLEAIKSDLDAVVLDLMLPDGEGETVLRQLRREAPRTPVAVTTGVNDARRIAEVERMRPTVLLKKPIALTDLLNAIKQSPDTDVSAATVTPPD
jgi:DNA-binding response OmpR family regulator